MFGKRRDGVRVKHSDPILGLTPYLMPMRCDSQVFLSYDSDFISLTEYAARKSREGFSVTFMEIVLAAFVRAISQVPEANRFIMNKQLFSRKELSASLAVLVDTADNSIAENVVKINFDPTDTIYDVAARVKARIEAGRKATEGGDDWSIRLASTVLKIPGFANFLVTVARVMDRYGIMPKAFMEALPFYSSVFITNLASIGLTKAYHHLYNWGDVSMFISMGTTRRSYAVDAKGNPKRKAVLPLGFVIDERICAGAVYAKMFAAFKKYLADPSLLEVPPEKVFYNPGAEYHEPKPEGVYVPN